MLYRICKCHPTLLSIFCNSSFNLHGVLFMWQNDIKRSFCVHASRAFYSPCIWSVTQGNISCKIRVQQRKNPVKHGYIVVRYNNEILYIIFLKSHNNLFSNEMNIFYCIQFKETLKYQNSLILANSKDIWQCPPIYLYDIFGHLSFNKSNWI